MKKILCAILFSVNIFFAYAENNDTINKTDEIKSLFSLDTSLTMTALKNYGYGIGISYERKLTNFLSIKPGFGHIVCFSDVMVVTVNLQLFLSYYPLSNGLDKLYIGLGNGVDFIMYQNDINKDTAIWLAPIIGWKWKVLPYLMIEPFIGWKFFVDKTNNYGNVDRYLNGGFQWGIGLKLFINDKNKKK
jgi:hypothetical protein